MNCCASPLKAKVPGRALTNNGKRGCGQGRARLWSMLPASAALLCVLLVQPGLAAAEAETAHTLALDLLARDQAPAELRQMLAEALAAGRINLAEATQLAQLAAALSAPALSQAERSRPLDVDTTRRAEAALATLAATLDGVPEEAKTQAVPGKEAQPDTDAPAAPRTRSRRGEKAPAAAALRVGAVKAASSDHPALALVEGEGIAGLSAGQRLQAQRDGSTVVELQVLRIDAGRAMAVILAATWAEGAETELRVGEALRPVD